MRSVILWVLLGSCPCWALATDGVRLTITTANTAQISGDKFGIQTDQRAPSAGVSARGDESSQCTEYGRQSSASSSANTIVQKTDDLSASIQLDANVKAFGGHFRTCGACLANVCIGIFGHDTSASAQATPSALATISFDPSFPPTDYRLDLSALNDSGYLMTELKDGAGQVLPLVDTDGRPTILHGRPGATYFLSVRLPLAATDKGGCCSNEQSAKATITAGIRLERAPILAARGQFVPFIAGGSQTTAYPYVGAIKIGDELHCTGTLVGTSTVLTAAHCVYGFESRLLTSTVFIIGSNVQQPDQQPQPVVGYDFPGKSAADPYSYDPQHYANDIAVLYLKAQPKLTPVKLHNGKPAWSDIIAKQLSLTFVGFGYDLLNRQQVAPGIKREASWYVSVANERTVEFPASDKGTCKGDSGGPAFLIESGDIMQMAITSGSETATCRDGGVETRVDYFLPWLSPRIH